MAESTSMPRKNYGISRDDFCRIWQTAGCVQDVATKTGIPVRSCASRAAFYRKRGINLKRFNSGPIDADAINQMLDNTK